MSTKQKIILHRYRDGYSERRISRELKINRETVRRYLAEYARAREKLSNASDPDEVLIEEIVKAPKYDSSNRGTKKFTNEISQEVDRLLQASEEKRSRGLHKQVMKKIDILEYLQEKGYDIGYTSVCNHINKKLDKRKEAYRVMQHSFIKAICIEYEFRIMNSFGDTPTCFLNIRVRHFQALKRFSLLPNSI